MGVGRVFYVIILTGITDHGAELLRMRMMLLHVTNYVYCIFYVNTAMQL